MRTTARSSVIATIGGRRADPPNDKTDKIQHVTAFGVIGIAAAICLYKTMLVMGVMLMIRAAFSYCNDRIAPVFDVSRNLMVVDADSLGRVVSSFNYHFKSDNPLERVSELAELQVEQLVCGAITKELERVLSGAGVQLFSFMSGTYYQMVRAWLNNRLDDRLHAMPGCNREGRKRRSCGRHNGKQNHEGRAKCQTEMEKVL